MHFLIPVPGLKMGVKMIGLIECVILSYYMHLNLKGYS